MASPFYLRPYKSFEAAMALVIVLRESLPGDYVVVSQVSEKKIIHRERHHKTQLIITTTS
jgi:hypothetical protein